MAISVDIRGLDQLVRRYRRSPRIVIRQANKAIRASVFEIVKRNTDGNLRFKTPRALRSGNLQKSIRENIVLRDLYGSIGPDTSRIRYARRVHRDNKFMPRLVRLAQSDIDRHFEDALDNIADNLS